MERLHDGGISVNQTIRHSPGNWAGLTLEPKLNGKKKHIKGIGLLSHTHALEDVDDRIRASIIHCKCFQDLVIIFVNLIDVLGTGKSILILAQLVPCCQQLSRKIVMPSWQGSSFSKLLNGLHT